MVGDDRDRPVGYPRHGTVEGVGDAPANGKGGLAFESDPRPKAAPRPDLCAGGFAGVARERAHLREGVVEAGPESKRDHELAACACAQLDRTRDEKSHGGLKGQVVDPQDRTVTSVPVPTLICSKPS